MRAWRSRLHSLSKQTLIAQSSTSAMASSAQSKLSPPDTQSLRQRAAKFIPDYLTPMPSHLLNTTLADLEPPVLSSHVSSSPIIQKPAPSLPQGHHLVYFPIQTAPSQLAPDGADMDHSPGMEFAKRLWAGGEVIFHPGSKDEIVLDGRPWACKEEIGDVRVKNGAAEGSEKVFVDVWRRYGAGHEGADSERKWAIEERRTLVFMRNDASPSQLSPDQSSASPGIKYPHKPTHSITMIPTPRHLFHFSALTFNAHSIHIDPEYARSTDGHRALLVHGPLSLALMLRVLTSYTGRDVAQIAYRNHAPLYVHEELRVCVREREKGNGEEWDVWVEGPAGGLAVKGTATLAQG